MVAYAMYDIPFHFIYMRINIKTGLTNMEVKYQYNTLKIIFIIPTQIIFKLQ
jgi:hypothetical protein